MRNYKGYELHYYPNRDNKYQTFKARPYDDAEYYWAYTYDQANWKVVYKGKVIQQFQGTFEKVIDLIEEQNKNIKARMVHW